MAKFSLHNTVSQVSAAPPALPFPTLHLIFCSLPLKSPHVAPVVSSTGQNRHFTGLLLKFSPLYLPLYIISIFLLLSIPGTLKMGATYSSKTSMTIHQLTRHHIPEDLPLLLKHHNDYVLYKISS